MGKTYPTRIVSKKKNLFAPGSASDKGDRGDRESNEDPPCIHDSRSRPFMEEQEENIALFFGDNQLY